MGPFDDIAFDLHESVNVFTGPNNSGKSTALLMLADLVVYPFSVPEKLVRSPNMSWQVRYSAFGDTHELHGTLPTDIEALAPMMKEMGFTCFIPAYRASTNFRALGPTVRQDVDEQVDRLVRRISRDWPSLTTQTGTDRLRIALRENIGSETSDLSKRGNLIATDPSIVYDDQIIQRLVNLDYASYRRNRPNITHIMETVASIVSAIAFDFPLKYAGIGEDEHGLFPQFNTPNGRLPLNVLSQGTQALIQCLIHILLGYAEYYDFIPAFSKEPGVVIIDEVDAHLHPNWRRGIISALTDHLPMLQIFCSSHSPLTVAGREPGQVQLLRRDEPSGRVTVSTNEVEISGWTADEILRTVLGVPNPTDLATANKVVRLQELRRKSALSNTEAEELESLRLMINRQVVDGPRGPHAEMEDLLARAVDRPPKQPAPTVDVVGTET